jgi:mevalonate kinase
LETEIGLMEDAHPIRLVIQGTLDTLGLSKAPAMQIIIRSTIPLAGGLGSGAAVSVAIIRAVSNFLGKPLAPEAVSAIAFEVEKTHHGTPSGIDNTVIAYGMPVLFQQSKPIQTFQVGAPFHFLIADTGIQASTLQVVDGVRGRREGNSEQYDQLFDSIDALTVQAFTSLQIGDREMTGRWMTENHALLQQMGVSSPALDQLAAAAMQSGALGAKLSGAGVGGNLIALVQDDQREVVQTALLAQGATRIIQTRLE